MCFISHYCSRSGHSSIACWAKHNPLGNYPSEVQYCYRNEITEALVSECVHVCAEGHGGYMYSIWCVPQGEFECGPERCSFKMCPTCNDWLALAIGIFAGERQLSHQKTFSTYRLKLRQSAIFAKKEKYIILYIIKI